MDIAKANTLTQQELFDYVVSNVIEQGEASVGEHSSCVYRGANGTKCAVGFLLSDDDCAEYGDLLECTNSSDLGFEGTTGDIAYMLQSAHDGAHSMRHSSGTFVEKFKIRCREIAAKKFLNPTVCNL